MLGLVEHEKKFYNLGALVKIQQSIRREEVTERERGSRILKDVVQLNARVTHGLTLSLPQTTIIGFFKQHRSR